MFLLDTDTVTSALHNHPRVIWHLKQHSAQDVWISIVTVEEMMRGATAAINAVRTRKGDVRKSYEFLGEVFEILNSFPLLYYTEHAHQIYGALPAAITQKHPNDCRIAAIAFANAFTVVTRNIRHFEGLVAVENWFD